MSVITTHVLDLVAGGAASGVAVSLWRQGDAKDWIHIADGHTDGDGRVGDLLGSPLEGSGTYRLSFQVGDYYASRNEPTFYPAVDITFSVGEGAQHYHVPLLLSRFGYSTYRGT